MPEGNLIGRRLETPPTKTTHRRVGAVSRPRSNARRKSDRSAPGDASYENQHRRVGAVSRPRSNARGKSDRSAPGDASYEKHTPPRRSRRLETPPTKSITAA